MSFDENQANKNRQNQECVASDTHFTLKLQKEVLDFYYPTPFIHYILNFISILLNITIIRILTGSRQFMKE